MVPALYEPGFEVGDVPAFTRGFVANLPFVGDAIRGRMETAIQRALGEAEQQARAQDSAGDQADQ